MRGQQLKEVVPPNQLLEKALDCTSSGPSSLFPSPPGRVLGEGYVLKTFCHLTGPITSVIQIYSQQ